MYRAATDRCRSQRRARVTSVASAGVHAVSRNDEVSERHGNKISDWRLEIASAQPRLGNNSEHSSVGKGGKQRPQKDGMIACRKGWEDSRE